MAQTTRDNIPQGFQKTEVGVIPEDWEVKKLFQICLMKSGESITSKEIGSNYRYPCFGGNGFRGYTKKFTHNGNYALIGRQGALCGNVTFMEGHFFASEHAVVVTPSFGIDVKWLSYVLTIMNLNQYSESSAQPGLSVEKIAKLQIPLPPTLAEQTAIANALSDMDALIDAQDKLIHKKRLIKQGAMQELLRPKEGWVEVTIQELINKGIIVGHLDGNHGELYPRSHEFKSTGVPYVGANDFSGGKIKYSNCKYLSAERANTFLKGISQKGDVLFAHNATVGPVAIVDDSFRKVILSTTATYYRCDNERLLNKFLFYFFQSTNFRKQYQAVMMQSTRAQVPITQQRKFSILMPSCTEQSRIAEILSTMDTEIEQLETQLSKYKQMKAGMMQELLTGKKRLNR